MRKMYIHPITDIMAVKTDYMMIDPVSKGQVTDPNAPPTVGAPERGAKVY